MANSAGDVLARLVALLFLFQYVQAKTVTYDFNVTWVMANPDGLLEREVIGINGHWPLPPIEVDQGDRLVVNMYNGLGDKDTSIHFHGMFQNGTNGMDGPAMVTQCPIPPGSSFTYNFTIEQHGTYWYHCHTDGCYPDGYRQSLIVHDNSSYFHDMYDEEYTITMSDWYHNLVKDIMPSFISLSNPTGAEPIPQSFLFNDTQNSSLSVQPGKTYLLRLINISAFVAQYFYIEDHSFKIVEIDALYNPRHDENSTDRNYPIVTVVDSVLLDSIPTNLQLNYTNLLEYNASAAHPQADIRVSVCTDLIPFDDINLVPYDKMPLLPDPDLTIDLTVYMKVLDNGADYSMFNNISYTKPKVPTLYTVLSAGDLATDATVYGDYTHAVVLEHNQVVQLVLNNGDTGSHPFHLHGHQFQVIDRAPGYGAHFYDYASGDPLPYDPSNHAAFPEYPARRDTFVLPPQGHFVIRFVADNPGVWFFHCHIDWHLAQGLGMLMIEAPSKIQERVTIPEGHYEVCKAAGVDFEGNAAGNTINFLDLAGQNKQVGWLPAGFTPKGIVAMVFSCASAFLGMAFISVYGASGIKSQKREEPEMTERNEASNEEL